MPSSQIAATERRNDRTVAPHEPPKLKTTLKTPPKQATNPLQFVKVGPCSLYRSAQEQLQKVQETKKIKQEVRDDPEDWQSNLDNWKSSRRKRQEHIIERVVEVKKLELEEHDRQRRRSKTFSEMMEERGSRGRKLSMSLAMYHEEDVNDLSDLGIGTSSGKSSVSGDTHDDMQSVMSDRDSEIDKNQSDVENTNDNNNMPEPKEETPILPASLPPLQKVTATTETPSNAPTMCDDTNKSESYENEFRMDNDTREYDSGNTATASSPEPEEYTYEGAIRGYVSRVSQNIPRRALTINQETTREATNANVNEDKSTSFPVVKVDVLKRREIFERASRNSVETRSNNINNNSSTSLRTSSDQNGLKSIKSRLSCLGKQKSETENTEKEFKAAGNRLSGDMGSIRERLSHLEKETSEREKKVSNRKTSSEELDKSRSLCRERVVDEKLSKKEPPRVEDQETSSSSTSETRENDEIVTVLTNINEKSGYTSKNDVEASTGNGKNALSPEDKFCAPAMSERSSSPDSEYREAPPRASFHRSLDSLDADASSGHDNFERVQSLEELDYTTRYPASSSSTELLNDLTDREDSGIHTADVSCSVSQADEPVDEEVVHHPETIDERQEIVSEILDSRNIEDSIGSSRDHVVETENPQTTECQIDKTPITIEETAVASATSGILSNKNISATTSCEAGYSLNDGTTGQELSSRPIVYQSPKVPPRRSPPEQVVRSSIKLSDDKVEKKLDVDADEQQRACEVLKKSANNSPEAKRPISKIPTPLPRKSVNVRISPSSSGTLVPINSPVRVSNASKITNKTSGSTSSKIPFSTTTTTTKSIEDSAIVEKQPERRRTVVEICEKVVLTNADISASPPVTPFVTVVRLGNERNTEESRNVDSPTENMSNREDESSNYEEEEDSQITIPEPRQQRRIYEIRLDEPEVLSIPAPSPRSNPPSNLKLSIDANSAISKNSSPSNSDPVEMNFDLTPTSKQIPQFNLAGDEEFVTGLTFPLGPPTSVEPPKEKPPPPPTDLTDEEDNLPIEPLKRLNSTRRIKKELRTRRSDFLGIEGMNDDYLERELTLTKPPDMATILAEERRVEQLNRRSYDTDSNYERDSSHERDSGVELGHAEDWRKQPVSPDMSEHSRQSSEPFGASVTSSEEDEITKKEREIIEVLEKEEQWRYGNNREQNSDIGEKLAHKLRELEEEKMQLERERAQESELRRRQEEIARQKEEDALREQMEQREAAKRASEMAKRLEEQKIRDEEILRRKAEEMRIQQEIEEEKERRLAVEAARRQEDSRRARSMEINQINTREQMVVNSRNDDDLASGEVLRVERELLQLEQEELKRRRTNVAYRQQRQIQLAEKLQEQWQSLQDVANGQSPANNSSSCCKYEASVARATAPINYRSSMPNLWLQENQRRRPPPPPIPPSKPSRLVEQMHRDVTIRNSRIPSADSIPQQVEGERLIRGGSTSTLSNNGGQQMTKQTLQALSAVPRPRIVKGDEWVQRRKSDVPRGTLEYNYQHWLIQEAEQRRINEKNQRSVARKPQQHVTGTSVPYNAVAQSSRSDNKPLPDSIIQTLTQRVQNRAQERPSPPPPPQRRRLEQSSSHEHLSSMQHQTPQHVTMLQHQKVHQFAASNNTDSQEKMLSVSGKKKCSHCGDELGRGAAMIIESLRLFYHMECFKCCVCHVRLGDGLMGTDVRVRNHKLHCHNCYSSDDGVKFSCV